MFNRCPKAHFRENPDAGDLLRQYRWLERFRIPPHAGGMEDQPARFLDAVEIIDYERTRCRKAMEILGANRGDP